MKEIIINSQEEFDNIESVKAYECLFVKASVRLGKVLSVYGKLTLEKSVDCSRGEGRYVVAWGNSSVVARENSSVVARENSSVVARENSSVVARENSSVVAWGNSSVEARENSSVVARENSSVVAWGNSSVVARENSSVVARENSSVVAWGNSSVEARENSSVEARENSSVEARENSSVEAWGNSSVVARGNSSVVARENSSVEAWGNSVIRLIAECFVKVTLFGFSVLIKPKSLKVKILKKSKTALIQNYKPLEWFEANGIEKTANVNLFKRVSKDWKTQEGTPNETEWKIGTTLTHSSWKPKENECGEHKFHACSRPYFCDEFRSTVGDRYIALKIARKDTYAWKNPQYPYKIAFCKGTVLYECDKFGKKI